jgi:hypothetical protein
MDSHKDESRKVEPKKTPATDKNRTNELQVEELEERIVPGKVTP